MFFVKTTIIFLVYVKATIHKIVTTSGIIDEIISLLKQSFSWNPKPPV